MSKATQQQPKRREPAAAANSDALPAVKTQPPAAEPPTTMNVWPAACPLCGSTSRANYSRIRTKPKGGRSPTGRDYTHISIKSTRCLKCGRPRTERHFLNVYAGDQLPADL